MTAGQAVEVGSVRRNPYLVLAVLSTAAVSYAFMQTLVLPALPFFQGEFEASATSVAWIATVFWLSSAVLTPILGRLGDTYGKQRLLVVTMTIYALSTFCATFAPGLEILILFRAMQGAGGAVFPLSFGIVRDEFPRDKVGLGVGTVSGAFGIGTAFGFVISGVVLETLSWHWLFVIGLIPAAASAVAIALIVPESPVRMPARPDYVGAGIFAVSLLSLLLAITKGNEWGWGSAPLLGLFAAAAIGFAVWVWFEVRVSEPMVDMSVFARGPLGAINLAAFLVGFGMFSAYILMPGFLAVPTGLPEGVAERLDYGFGASPLEIGLFFLPTSVLQLLSGPVAGMAAARWGSTSVLRAGTTILTLSLALIALAHGTRWLLYVWMGLLGMGVATCLAALAKLVVDRVHAHQTGVATGMNTIVRMTGGALGGQIGAAVIAGHTIAGTHAPLEGGFTAAFLVAAAGALLALAPTVLPLWRARAPGGPAAEAALAGEAAAAAAMGGTPATRR